MEAKYIDVWCDNPEEFKPILDELDKYQNESTGRHINLRFNNEKIEDSDLLLIINDKYSDADAFKIQISTNIESISNNIESYVICEDNKKVYEAAFCIISASIIPGLVCFDLADLKAIFKYSYFKYLSIEANEEPRSSTLSKMIVERIRGLGDTTFIGFAPHNNMRLDEISKVITSIRDEYDAGDKDIAFISYQDDALKDNYMRVSLFVNEKMI